MIKKINMLMKDFNKLVSELVHLLPETNYKLIMLMPHSFMAVSVMLSVCLYVHFSFQNLKMIICLFLIVVTYITFTIYNLQT